MGRVCRIGTLGFGSRALNGLWGEQQLLLKQPFGNRRACVAVGDNDSILSAGKPCVGSSSVVVIVVEQPPWDDGEMTQIASCSNLPAPIIVNVLLEVLV